MNRGLRRAQKERAKDKARRLARIIGLSGQYPMWTREALEHWAMRMWKNRHPCSCEMCRNARRAGWTKAWAKLTLQERRVMAREK